MSKVQDDEVGDGTTSVTVLAAELLRVKLRLFARCLGPSHSVTPVALPLTGGGASGGEEDPPTDHHLGLEEGHAGGARRPEGGGGRPQVSAAALSFLAAAFFPSSTPFLAAVSVATTRPVSRRTC